MNCWRCDEVIADERVKLGFRTCLVCGEKEARKVKHCIVPMNKSNYIAVTDPAMLAQLNPKRTT